MKLIIAGPRDCDDIGIVHYAIAECTTKTGWTVTEIVVGGARGVDSAAEALARLHGHKVKLFKANWHIFGKIAGPMRNIEMADYADALLLIWRGDSLGSRNMLNTALRKGLPVCEYNFVSDVWTFHNVKLIS